MLHFYSTTICSMKRLIQNISIIMNGLWIIAEARISHLLLIGKQ